MQKLTVIVLLLFLGLGLTQPGGYMQFCNLEEQYKTCSLEDHDITPLDFVFEHLLNLESVVNLFEGEHEYSGEDHPHMPFQNSKTSTVTFLAITSTSPDIDTKTFEPGKIKYTFPQKDGRISNFHAEIFHPPAV